MSEEQFGIVNEGDAARLEPVILKDHSKDPVIVPEVKVEAPVVEKRKRGRPKKATAVREYYCSTCREKYDDLTVMKMGAGEGRFAIFCPQDQRSLGFSDFAADEKMAKLLKNTNKR